MHARVIMGQTEPHTYGDLKSAFHSIAQDKTRQQTGYQGVLLLGDQRLGKALTISLWDSAAAMHAGEGEGYLPAAIANLEHLFIGAPVIQHYEVGVERGTLGAQAAGKPARVIYGQAAPGKLDEIFRLFAADVIPATTAEPGFVGLLLLGDAETNRTLSVGIWESDDALHASEHSGYLHTQMGKLAHLYEGPPTREHFMVLTHL